MTNRSYGYNVVIMCNFIYVTHSTHSVDFNGTQKIMEEYLSCSHHLHVYMLDGSHFCLSEFNELYILRENQYNIIFSGGVLTAHWNWRLLEFRIINIQLCAIFKLYEFLTGTELNRMFFSLLAVVCCLLAYSLSPILNYPVTGNVLNNPLLTNH